jgi:hypothetical protein
MLSKYEIEYEKLFRRLMILEITIRNRLLFATQKVNANETYKIFKGFFINPYIYEKYDTRNKGNVLQKIIKNKEIPDNHEKFTKLINSLYLSHLLDFVLNYKQFYLNKEIKNLFYFRKPETNEAYLLLSKKRLLIQKLRNDIMHFNFESFERNRESYTEALCLFEIHIGCSICKLHSLTELGHKPAIKDILIALQKVSPELFQSGQPEGLNRDRDRALLELFDDLAFLNGYDYNELPSPWSVLRQKYELTKVTTEVYNK